MAELSIVTMQQCASLNPDGDIRGYTQQYINGEPHCSCPAYKYSKDRYCKHLTIWELEKCDFHEQIDGPPAHDGLCPKCGGPTEYVRVGV